MLILFKVNYEETNFTPSHLLLTWNMCLHQRWFHFPDILIKNTKKWLSFLKCYSKYTLPNLITRYLPEMYSEPCERSKIELFAKIGFQSLSIFAKCSILDVSQGSEYFSVYRRWRTKTRNFKSLFGKFPKISQSLQWTKSEIFVNAFFQ